MNAKALSPLLGPVRTVYSTSTCLIRVLIACIILISYEGIRGDYAASQMHMSSGRLILMENRQKLLSGKRRVSRTTPETREALRTCADLTVAEERSG